MKSLKQLSLFGKGQNGRGSLKDPAAMDNKKLPIHRWVTWIAGFSATFTGDIIGRYLPNPRSDSIILDPFAGVGTTLVEAFTRGINTVGFEINPFAALVSSVKLESAMVDLEMLKSAIFDYESFMDPIERRIDQIATIDGRNLDLYSIPKPRTKAPINFKSRIPFFSVPVERKVLFTFDFINGLRNEVIQRIFRMVFGAVMVTFSNYSYEPSLGSRPAAGKSLVDNACVSQIMARKLREVLTDITQLQHAVKALKKLPWAAVYQQSFFDALERIERGSVDLVITSPPYLNNYHYVRNTRPHLFWLNFVSQPKELQRLELGNYGKFWQTVREQEPIKLVFDLPALQEVIDYVGELKQEKGVYGGRGWANYIATYFNDTYRCITVLKEVLKPQGTAVIVVGNSVIQGVEIKVDEFFSQIAVLHDLEIEGIYIIREKRIGSSIVNTGVRQRSHKKPELYDAAVVLKR
jgi:DNA modification methylase